MSVGDFKDGGYPYMKTTGDIPNFENKSIYFK
jgi:hypothetical protein